MVLEILIKLPYRDNFVELFVIYLSFKFIPSYRDSLKCLVINITGTVHPIRTGAFNLLTTLPFIYKLVLALPIISKIVICVR